MANYLPEVFGDVDDLPRWSDTSAPAGKLVDVWKLRMGPPDEYISPVSSRPDSQSAPPIVSVHADLVAAANAVVQATEMASGNAHKRHSAVVLGRIEISPNATVAIYQRAVGYFVGLAHLDKRNPEKIPKDEEMISQLEIIEAALRARLASFFDVAHELASLQAAANRRHLPPSGGSE